MLVRSPMVMMSLSPRKTALNQTLALVVEDHRADHVALSAMNHSSPRNETLRSPSEKTAMIAARSYQSALLSSPASMKPSESVFVPVRGLR